MFLITGKKLTGLGLEEVYFCSTTIMALHNLKA